MNTRNPAVPLIAIAGWLFADLLLVFFIVSLGTDPTPEQPEPEPSPSPTPEPEPPSGLESVPVEVELTTSTAAAAAGEESVVHDLRDALGERENELAGREAGMVLTFGGTSTGRTHAENVNELLPEADSELFREAATREFHDLAASSGSVKLEIYLFTT